LKNVNSFTPEEEEGIFLEEMYFENIIPTMIQTPKELKVKPIETELTK
jgi:hypothetical protein